MEVKFDDKGLVPTIIQDNITGDVLMLGYMDREALEKTIKDGRVHFYSRSRKRIWMKGESSKVYLYVSSIKLDCDGDAILVLVNSDGPVCHTGECSCFFTNISQDPPLPIYNFPYKLYERIQERKRNPAEDSYTSKVLKEGVEKIARKVGEEALELVIASLERRREDVIYETADLVYHTIVLLSAFKIQISEIIDELVKRYREQKRKKDSL